jgi:hypothetical protein
MVVVVVTRLWGWKMWSSNPGTNKDFVSSPKLSDRFQAQISLVLFTHGKVLNLMAHYSYHLLPILSKGLTVNLLLHMPLRLILGKFYFQTI